MAQHDYIISDQSFPALRADLNNALAAIATGNSGNAAPSVTYPYMVWNDTLNGLTKIRNASDTAWIVVGALGAANLGLASLSGATFTGPVHLPAGSTVVGYAAVAGATFTGAVTVPSLNGGPLAGFRNAIINGNFKIWQSGTTFTGSEYGADQWMHGRAGTTHTVTRQAFTVGQTAVPGEPEYFCRTVVSSVGGASNYSHQQQRIENVRTFAGQQVTFRLWAKADATKSVAVECVQNFGTGGSPSAEVTSIGVTKVPIGTGWQSIPITVTLPSISGKTLGTNNNDYLALNIWFDAGSTFNSRTSTLGQQSGTFDIAEVQGELGTVATPFERLPDQVELERCKRYAQWVPYNINFNAATAGEGMEAPITWSEMRATPNAAALTADPNTTQLASNNAANAIQRLTPCGGSVSGSASAAGASFAVGYRSFLTARL